MRLPEMRAHSRSINGSLSIAPANQVLVLGRSGAEFSSVTACGNITIRGEASPRGLCLYHVEGRPSATPRARLPRRKTHREVGPRQPAADEGCCDAPRVAA